VKKTNASIYERDVKAYLNDLTSEPLAIKLDKAGAII
jgi:hypothetical protein